MKHLFGLMGVCTACLLVAARPMLPQVAAAPVHWTGGTTMPGVVHAGTLFTVDVYAAIAPGWHLYAMQQPNGGPMATEIALDKGDTAELLRVSQSRPLTSVDPQFQIRTAYFEQTAAFTLHARTETVKESGVATLHVLVRYQACSDRMCLPPQNAAITIPYRVRP